MKIWLRILIKNIDNNVGSSYNLKYEENIDDDKKIEENNNETYENEKNINPELKNNYNIL